MENTQTSDEQETSSPAQGSGSDPDPSTLTELHAAVQKLQNQFEMRLLSDQHKEKMIDRLHQELQGYRNDLIRSQMRPVLLDLIQLFDSYQNHLRVLKNKPTEELNAQELLEALVMVPDDLLDILYRQGVEPFELPETEFQPSKQKLIQKKETDNSAHNRRVATSLRPGFSWGEELLRQEWVEVFVFTDQKPEKPMEPSQPEIARANPEQVEPASENSSREGVV